MRKACGAISVVLVLLLPATMAATLTAKVEAVIDGDTFSIHTVSNLSYQVRLAGLDAPEEKQTFGGYALGALSEKILGKTVTVEHAAKDGDNPIIGQVHSESAGLISRWLPKGLPGSTPRTRPFRNWRRRSRPHARSGVGYGVTRIQSRPGTGGGGTWIGGAG